MTPQAMPEAPAPTPVLSRTTICAPSPSRRAFSSLARCHAVESPWTPAPMMTNRAAEGGDIVRLPCAGEGVLVAGLEGRQGGVGVFPAFWVAVARVLCAAERRCD